MASLNLWQEFDVNVGGEIKKGGSRNTAVTRTMTGGVYETRTTVADNYAVETLWDTGYGNLDNWNYLFILSNENVLLELSYDRGGASEHISIVQVTADVPMMINGDAISDVALVAGGAVTTYACDQIRVMNNQAEAAGDATVRLVLIEN